MGCLEGLKSKRKALEKTDTSSELCGAVFTESNLEVVNTAQCGLMLWRC